MTVCDTIGCSGIARWLIAWEDGSGWYCRDCGDTLRAIPGHVVTPDPVLEETAR